MDRNGTHQSERVAQENKARRVVWEILPNFIQGPVYRLIVVLADLVRLLIDHVWSQGPARSESRSIDGQLYRLDAHITAWGWLAREVVRRNLRR